MSTTVEKVGKYSEMDINYLHENETWIVLKHEHLPTMRLAHAMTLKAILIATCLLAHLAIPSQLCETFGFDAVAYGFGGEESAALFRLSHSTSRYYISARGFFRDVRI